MNKIVYLAALLSFGVAMPAAANQNMDKGAYGKKTDHYFNKADANGDGKVSRQENRSFADRKFDEVDSNNDGMVSRREMNADKKKYGRNTAYNEDYNNYNPSAGRNRSASAKQSETLDIDDDRDEQY